MKTRMQPRVRWGLLVLVISVAALLVVASPMQRAWGMWGLALTEILLLIVAILPLRVFRWSFREVFAMKMPSLTQVLGVLVLWLGSYVAVLVSTVALYYFFPSGMDEVSNAISDFFTSVPLPLALFVVAVLPGVCEEFLHRGLIQYTFQGKPKWLTIIGMAIIFGLFHLDLYRFIGTAILGGVLTYIMLKTNNLLLPILLHVINNTVSISLAFTSTENAGAAYMSLREVGSSLVIASVVPFLFLLGGRLLTPHQSSIGARRNSRATRVVAVLLSLLSFVSGAVLLVNGPPEPVLRTVLSQDVAPEDLGHQLPFTVETQGEYRLELAIEGDDGLLTTITIRDHGGAEVYRITGQSLAVQSLLELNEGEYVASVRYDHTGSEYLKVKIDIVIR